MNPHKLTHDGRDTLLALYQAAETGQIVIDPDDLNLNNPILTLETLQTRKLATPEADGLWRITLGALVYARNRWGKHTAEEAA